MAKRVVKKKLWLESLDAVNQLLVHATNSGTFSGYEILPPFTGKGARIKIYDTKRGEITIAFCVNGLVDLTYECTDIYPNPLFGTRILGKQSFFPGYYRKRYRFAQVVDKKQPLNTVFAQELSILL